MMMKYEPGKLGIAEGLALVFILTFARVFLSTPLNFLIVGENLAWFAQLLAGASAFAMFYALTYVMARMGGDLLCVCQRLLGKKLAWITAVYLIIIFFLNAALLIRQFAENTLLTALPRSEFIVILLIYTLTSMAIAITGIEGLARATYIIMPFGIFGMILVLISLYPYYDVDCMFPLLGNGVSNALIGGIQATGINFAVLILAIIAPSLRTTMTVRKAAVFGLGLSVGLRAISFYIYMLVFDITVGSEKVLPFFEMARLVYLGLYLQHVESLFILLWVIIGILAIAISVWCGAYLMARLFGLPTLQPIIPLACTLVMQAAMVPPDIITVIQLDAAVIATAFNAALFGLPSILAIAYFRKRRKDGNRHVAAT